MFTKIAFTDGVKKIQEMMGSRKNYARTELGAAENDTLSENEAEFIEQRDSFYMASSGETGWPYIQHRGGPKGFLKVLSNKELAFADYAGNRQYISVGNIQHNQKVALIFVDYPNQARLKILGHAKVFETNEDPNLTKKILDESYRARVERIIHITIEGYDWNCPAHITPRWTADEIQSMVGGLQERIAELEQQIKMQSGKQLGNS